MDISSILTELLNTIIKVLIIPLIPAVAGYLISFIKKQAEKITNQVKSKELTKYINLAENAVISAVTAVNQIYVDNLKEKNGKLSKEEQKAAFEMARERVLKIIGETGINVLKSVYMDFETWLESQIEYYVKVSKTRTADIQMRQI